jgi:FKBP-type peptidyl-prolyl cis-trans isomerase
MATKKGQRIGIWIILIVLAIGSVGIYFVSVLANGNNAKDSATLQKAEADYTAAIQKQADQLSTKYYPVLSQYASEVGSFDQASVTSLQSTDLLAGDGATIADSTSYGAYYIGWNPSGKIFDQSIAAGKLKAPLSVQKNAGLISGWTKGVVGMKLGGVRELTIPADQAYGSQSPSADIPANSPLKFIVLAIPTPPAIPVPTILQNAQAAQRAQ